MCQFCLDSSPNVFVLFQCPIIFACRFAFLCIDKTQLCQLIIPVFVQSDPDHRKSVESQGSERELQEQRQVIILMWKVWVSEIQGVSLWRWDPISRIRGQRSS